MQEIDFQKESHDDAKAGEHNNALINKVALEMANEQRDGKNLLSFANAPSNVFDRYAMVTTQGIAKLPEGVVNAVKHNINHPTEALATIGMGAGMAVALKAVLPEAGPAGKIAGAALGAYFTYKAAEPIIDAYKKAGRATTMQDINVAAVQIGNAGGTFVVDSALAAVGYKAGAGLASRALALPAGKSFVSARDNFYNNVGAKFSDAMGVTPIDSAASLRNLHQHHMGVIPPYMLEEMAKRNPNNGDFLSTRNKTLELQRTGDGIKPRSDGDMHGAREVYDAKGQEIQPGDKARFEGEKVTGNPDVDRAYDYTGDVREFYMKEYGRNSIDGKGMKFVSTVNYGQNFENAFWDGKQMTYGRPGPDSPFKTFILRDVAGHEITHGITEMEANTKYFGQSGALNESYSDVFGALVDQYAKKQTADKASWVVGEGIWQDNVKGRGLRDMANPGTAYNDPAIGKDPQPAHMKNYVKTWGDNGGVHINSGIPNKAFAEFAKAVGGNAWETPGHVWFEARRAAGSNPSFAQFAFQTVEAANKLGKVDEVP
ncbi:MAG: M4 family metallopeptidase, partial [Candidatus Obscuribacterales bacterium]|nr:M4 family metallopeptidase [Candidatus Obscuribacterales bacterium]